MKAIATLSSKGYLYSFVLAMLFLTCLLPFDLQAQNLDSRAGDEAALEALYVSANGSNWNNTTGWSASGISLSNTIYGVEVASINGELRVTEIDLRGNNLTGDIEFSEIGNLKEMILFNVTFNALRSQIPSEIGNLRSLKYLYLSTSNETTPLHIEHPHEAAQSGGGQTHPGKNKGTEQNVFSGPVPVEIHNLRNTLEWFYCSWGALTSVPAEIFDMPAMVGLQLYMQPDVAHMQIPSTIGVMTNLTHLQFGGLNAVGGPETWNEHTNGWLEGPFPAEMVNLVNLERVAFDEMADLEGIPDFSNSPYIRTLNLPFTDSGAGGGSLPSWIVDGSLVQPVAIAITWPQGAEKLTGDLPAFGDMSGLVLFSVTNHNFTGSIPISYWDGNPIKHNFAGNSFTSVGTTDLTNLTRIQHLRWNDNEISGPLPNLDWGGPVENDFFALRVQNNRYVFSDLLWIPENGGGKPILQLYSELPRIRELSYAPQKPFGQARTATYASGTNIILDDFETVVTHKDNQYQWQKNGSNLSGATSRSLTIDNAQDSDAGTYTLVVTNPGAPKLTLTSEPITVEIGDGGSGTPPGAPALTSPSDGATDQPTTLTLDWEAATDAQSYRVELSTVSDFSNIVAEGSGLSATQWEASGLSNAATYYWRVRASNQYGAGSWSSVYDFTTIAQSTAPEPPALVSPSDGATGQAITLILDWDPSGQADSYRLQVSSVSDFSSTVVDQEGLTATSQEVSGLNNSATYHWRVRASNQYGTSSWSAVYDFTTENESSQTIAAPIQLSPGDGATGTSLTPTFTWETVDGADSYILHVSGRDPSEMVIEAGVTGTSYTPDAALKQERTHDWRVRAVVDGVEGTWSPIWTFTSGTEQLTAPSAPSLTSPSDGATDQPTTLTLDWEAASGAETYRVQVASSSDFSSIVAEGSGLTATQWEASGLTNSTGYFWRVQASNAAGSGGWSSAWGFTTEQAEASMETSLGQNYPNPFNPSTQIRFSLAETQQVSLKVYDTVGREVATIVEGQLTAGSYERTFNANNLASGVYFLRFVTQSRVLTSQMTLMK